MQRALLVGLVMLLFFPAVYAKELQKSLKHEWLGAWVVMTASTRSGCGTGYTANRVHGRRVSRSGSVEFEVGELARVDKVDLKRERIDLSVTLGVQTRRPYDDGPFTLYNTRNCKIELEIVLPRKMVKDKDLPAIMDAMSQVVERYDSRKQAEAADSWNRREVEPLPEDYEATLARHAAWKTEQWNLKVDAATEDALAHLLALPDLMEESEEYAAGFAQGVLDAREKSASIDSCNERVLISVDLEEEMARKIKSKTEGVSDDTVDGYGDGFELIYSLILIRDLPDCLEEVPEIPEEYRE